MARYDGPPTISAVSWQASVDVSPLLDELAVPRRQATAQMLQVRQLSDGNEIRLEPANTGQSIAVSGGRPIRPMVDTSPPNLGPAFAILPAEDRPWRPTPVIRFAV
jgi:hypothetical protein